jgi:hypothetical protein
MGKRAGFGRRLSLDRILLESGIFIACNPTNGGSTFLGNVGTQLEANTAQQLRAVQSKINSFAPDNL